MTRFGKLVVAALSSVTILLALCLCIMISSLSMRKSTDSYYSVAGYVVGYGAGSCVYVEDLHGTLWGINATDLEYREYVRIMIHDPGTPETNLDDVVYDIY